MYNRVVAMGCLVGAMLVSVGLAAEDVAVPIADVFAHNERENFDGWIRDMIIGTGMNGNNFANTYPPKDVNAPASWPTNHPSLWTATGNQYQDEFVSGFLLDATNSVNGKVGWIIFDLGTQHTLKTFYIWNIRSSTTSITATFNVYVAAIPAEAIQRGPTDNSTAIDYDFSSGGWTLINADGALTGTYRGNQSVDLTGNAGRYVAVEVLTNGGHATRCGLAEVGITVVPPPQGTVLIIR